MQVLMGFFLASLGFCLGCLPRSWFCACGTVLGTLLRWLGFRRQTILQNLAIAYPQSTAQEKDRILRANYQHYGILFLEFLLFFGPFARFLKERCEVEGEENLRQALAQGKGALVMTAHLGNWEALVAFGSHILNVPVTIATKQLKPIWLHNLVEAARGRLGVKMALEPKTMRQILQALKHKEIAGFVMDQYTGAPVGARVPFFGVPVGSQMALAKLALRTGAPVVPAVGIRTSDFRYKVRFEPALPLLQDADEDLAVLRNTAQYVSHTEEWVRENPEQWLWIHKRWKGDLSPLPVGVIGEILK